MTSRKEKKWEEKIGVLKHFRKFRATPQKAIFWIFFSVLHKNQAFVEIFSTSIHLFIELI